MKVKKFLNSLRERVGEDDYKIILDMAATDIKFNMIGFNKKVTPEYFICVCERCHKTLRRCGGKKNGRKKSILCDNTCKCEV